jgi:hypothetical protein
MLLAVKIVLVPALIAAVTLAARRWGPRVGGLLTALPVVAGPTLSFYAIEQGPAFAAVAAEGTLLGLIAVGGFCVAYAWCALRAPWPVSLAAGWLAFAVVTLSMYRVALPLAVDLILAVTVLLLVPRVLPRTGPAERLSERAIGDLLWLRMVAAAVLVFVLTSLADGLGPTLSGVLTPFPVATAIIAAFTHAQLGPTGVIAVFSCLLPGLASFAVFCFLMAATIRSLHLVGAIIAALSVQLAVQAFFLARMRSAPSMPAAARAITSSAIPPSARR